MHMDMNTHMHTYICEIYLTNKIYILETNSKKKKAIDESEFLHMKADVQHFNECMDIVSLFVC